MNGYFPLLLIVNHRLNHLWLVMLCFALLIPSMLIAAESNTLKASGAEHASGSLEVYSDNALELYQDKKMIVARGHAKAIRNNLTVKGDVLVAHYRDKGRNYAAAKPDKEDKNKGETASGSDNEVWRVEAEKNVSIASTDQIAYGDHADYNVDDSVVVLTGNDLRMTSPKFVITAKDSLEYWDLRHQAVARGQAVAIRENKRIQSDVLVADFVENDVKQMEAQLVHGYGHVVLTTKTEIVTGDKADYQVKSGLVVITGAVKMTRSGGLQLDGGYAVVNMNTGTSRLYPSPPGKAGSKQVKGMFIRQSSNPPSPAPIPNKEP